MVAIISPAIVSVIVGIGGLIFAYFMEHIGGLEPCFLCTVQRALWSVVIGAGLSVLWGFKNALMAWISRWLVVIVLGISALVAFYHVGIEQGLWSESRFCRGATIEPATTIEDLRAQLLAVKKPSCANVDWRFLSLSMAAWNGLISLSLFLWSFAVIMGSRREEISGGQVGLKDT